jgi:signal transduction histidine kinase
MRNLLRVLVIDDSAEDAALLLRMLKHGGFHPVHQRVDTRESMVAALESATWDIVISDWSMPQFSAPAAFALLKERNLDLPFIIVSGMIGEETAVEALRAGAHDFMLKEKLSRLGPAVERELREAELRRERHKLHDHLLLSERMASVGLLAAGVAHEINNPLACVMANLDLAARHLAALPEAGDQTAKIGQEIRNASEAAERIRQIVRDMKVFSRGGEDTRAPVDLHRVLELALRMSSHEIRYRARVERDYAPVPIVDANESRLGQVFLNLLVNAAQSIPEGNADRNLIRVSTRTDTAGNAVLEVSDTGDGIAKEIMGQLFTPFLTTKPIGVGTGLGLAICHRIIAAHGGEISVESQLGAGSLFRVSLPPRASSHTGELASSENRMPFTSAVGAGRTPPTPH